jgi:hypothetical protein
LSKNIKIRIYKTIIFPVVLHGCESWSLILREEQTWSDNKVRELATMCLPWQKWRETSVWFDDAAISACHSFIVVADLWQSLSEWRLLLSECAAVRMSELLVKLGKRGSEIREMLLQVYRDNAIKKTAFYKWVTHFSGGRESVTDKERSGQPADCQEHSPANEHRQRNS